jgi:hypothetical protein
MGRALRRRGRRHGSHPVGVGACGGWREPESCRLRPAAHNHTRTRLGRSRRRGRWLRRLYASPAPYTLDQIRSSRLPLSRRSREVQDDQGEGENRGGDPEPDGQADSQQTLSHRKRGTPRHGGVVTAGHPGGDDGPEPPRSRLIAPAPAYAAWTRSSPTNGDSSSSSNGTTSRTRNR